MSELSDKRENIPRSRKLTKKVCDENESRISRIRKKRARKSIIHGRKPFKRPNKKIDGNDLHDLLGNDCGYNEGTIYVANERINVYRMVFRAWAHERASLKSQWLVLRIGGADFLHCWVVDSVWLERAESLITK